MEIGSDRRTHFSIQQIHSMATALASSTFHLCHDVQFKNCKIGLSMMLHLLTSSFEQFQELLHYLVLVCIGAPAAHMLQCNPVLRFQHSTMIQKKQHKLKYYFKTHIGRKINDWTRIHDQNIE